MAIHTMDEAQRKTARLAGIMYLLTMVTANLGDFYVRRQLFAPADPVQTLRNIKAAGWLLRIGIGSDLITIAGNVILIAALYTILKPVNKNAALVAVFWSLLECAVAAFVTLNSLAALFLVGGKDSLQGFDAGQLETLARLFISTDRAGNRIAAVLFGLGSVVFCYLWFKSRYIPRVLAAWGIVASLVPILAPLATVLLPDMMDLPLRRARSGLPIMSFDIILGLWLFLKGHAATDNRVTGG